ncbi:repressor of the inhibitor of the protein kinase [Amphibalanus amphitrite]|uniref:Repressor of the inhibitor of the protein kinase n=1 Tax=Amphibalanus amphitrite TaxID=1232801 RepID=A0A6A4W848_AMPAM|nr:repressor of the inhibitor of the protein kinase [Amphibalanus amphitrite]
MGEEEVEVKMTGENIGGVILEKINELLGDNKKLVGCGFDGAAALSSKNVGAAAVLKRASPLCEYFHCAMHALNLCAAAGCKQRDVQNCMTTVKTVTSFFNMSAKRVDALKRKVREKEPEQPRKRLVTLCETRFLERHDSIIVFCELLPAVIMCLEEMQSWHSSDTHSRAAQLLGSLRSPSFLVALFALEVVSAALLPVSRALQAKSIDVATAAQGLDACIETLQRWRDEPEEQVANILIRADAVADDLGVTIAPPRCPARATHRANAGNCGDRASYYRVNCFLPLLSGTLEQMRARFGQNQQVSLKLCGLLPAQLKPWTEVEAVILRYRQFLDNEEVVKAEHSIWLSMWKDAEEERPGCAVAALEKCPQQLLPNISVLLQILAALPVSTAEPERFFSRVNLAATAIRASMSEERLEAICLLQVYRRCPDLTVETVLQEFSKKPRKKTFVL